MHERQRLHVAADGFDSMVTSRDGALGPADQLGGPAGHDQHRRGVPPAENHLSDAFELLGVIRQVDRSHSSHE